MMNRLTTASPHSTPSPTRFTGHVVIEAPTDPDQFLALDEELIALANTYEADCAIGRQAQSDIQYFVASPRENRDNDQFVRLANKFETRAYQEDDQYEVHETNPRQWFKNQETAVTKASALWAKQQ